MGQVSRLPYWDIFLPAEQRTDPARHLFQASASPRFCRCGAHADLHPTEEIPAESDRLDHPDHQRRNRKLGLTGQESAAELRSIVRAQASTIERLRARCDTGPTGATGQTTDERFVRRVLQSARLLTTALTPQEMAHAVSAVTEAAQTLEAYRA